MPKRKQATMQEWEEIKAESARSLPKESRETIATANNGFREFDGWEN